MSESNKQREVRIVGYDKRLLTIQMQLLAAVLLLPAMAFSSGWGAGVLGVAFFVLILMIFLQAMQLRKTGVMVRMEELESEAETRDESDAVSAEDIEATAAEEESEPEEPVEKEPQTHWSDEAFPDPDVELGLVEPEPTPVEEVEQKDSNP